ncbi:MAG TPA: bifunctional tetrahydrofolate synthase/dihydrofolate synthase [Sulfurivirga caldicuralii]|nr:bifunctional tetrahydrofolate synthase/dihydrofolate synthase [Sulfurivirga caldicuralii]
MQPPSAQAPLADWLDWQLRLHPSEIELGLARVRAVGSKLRILNPTATVITVAGTNGKGSSVAMLEAIFTAAGYRVGAYTSPHLRRYNERIRIEGAPVRDEALVAAFAAIEEARADVPLTFFEYGTLAALWLFARQYLDVILLEVGLGGRLDATNVVDAEIALITAIDVDHADWLGPDREAIGKEKAGIMRPGHHAVISDPNPPASVLAHAEALGVKLARLGDAFNWRSKGDGWDYLGASVLRHLPKPALPGAFQLNNAAGVLAVLERLPLRFYLPLRVIERGLMQVRHPGRLETRQVGEQRWLLDVAHNPQSAQALAQWLAAQSGTAWQSLFAALKDKEIAPMVEALRPFIAHWHLVPLEDPRAVSVSVLRDQLVAAGVDAETITLHRSLAGAVAAAQAQVQLPVLVWGSFMTVGGVMEVLDG